MVGPAPHRGHLTREPYQDSDKTAAEEMAMSWFVLVLSGVLEAVWATALGRSDGLTRPVPTATFVVALALSMGGLGYAMRTLPVGTSYGREKPMFVPVSGASGSFSGAPSRNANASFSSREKSSGPSDQ